MNVLAGHANCANLTLCHLRNPCTLELAASAFLLIGLGHVPPSWDLQKGHSIRRCNSASALGQELLISIAGELLFSRVLWDRYRVAQSNEELAKE